jgi:hypothetical protein
MNGLDHYREAEKLAAKADELLGHGEGQDTAAAWAAAAQVHATLALAAVTALGATLPAGDREEWVKEASVVLPVGSVKTAGAWTGRPSMGPKPDGQTGPPAGAAQ